MKLLRGKEYITAAILFLLGAEVLRRGASISSTYWQSVMANGGVTLLGLAAAILIVNAYFDYRSRKAAVYSLLKLVAPAIEEHHNELLQEAWNVFGKPQWGEIVDRYKDNNGDPRALVPDERHQLYSVIKARKGVYDQRFTRLEAILKELALILGWSFDPGILKDTFNCRFAISKFLVTPCDDSDVAVIELCEQFLDIELTSFQVFHGLIQLLGIAKDKVYGN